MTNSRLKELLTIKTDDLTPELQNELIQEIKNAKFFIPVIINSDNINHEDNQIKSDEPVTFEILTLKKDDKNILPLFSDEEALEQIEGFNVIHYAAADIAELILENENIDEIIINPNTESSIGMANDSFVYYCLEDQFKGMFNIEEDLKEYAVPLENNTVFYLRSETPFMVEDVEDGIFTATVPFKVSSRDVCNKDYAYLNVLVVPKGTMFLYLGNIIDDSTTQSDVILAPTLKFKLEEEKENNTFMWKCIEQDFKK